MHHNLTFHLFWGAGQHKNISVNILNTYLCVCSNVVQNAWPRPTTFWRNLIEHQC